MGIEFFSANAFNRKEDWEFAGYLCYMHAGFDEKKSKDIYEPYVIDHETYSRLCKNEVHSIIITHAEVAEIEKPIGKIQL